jgi:hypothetical protein
MNDIYWITRLDAINGIIALLFAISLAGVLITGIILYVDFLNVKDKEKIDEVAHKTVINRFRWFLVGSVIGALAIIFIPTKNDALIIYGVGGTIDYIKSNDTAKHLPDKTIDALDKYLDSINDKDKDKDKNR